MPDFVPAPGSTATSAPSPFIFLTVSGVAATRPSAGSISRATAMRISPPPRDRRLSSASATGSKGERDQRDHYHDDARQPRPAQKTMGRHDGRDHEDRKRQQPVTGDGADRQSQDDVGHISPTDDDQMNDTVVHRHARVEVDALRRRRFYLPPLEHSL